MTTQDSSVTTRLSPHDELFIDRLRGLSILRVVLVHLGLSWILTPYSEYVLAFLPVLFFVSGAVTFFSFRRASSTLRFMVRRVLMLTIPFYLIAFLTVGASLFDPSLLNIASWGDLVRWATLNPPTETMPYPLGHVWFLRALLVITVICLPLFYLAQSKSWVLLLGLLFSAMLATAQLFYSLSSPLHLASFNFYQPLSCLGFYCFGAWYFVKIHEGNEPNLFLPLAAFAITAASIALLHPQVGLGLVDHTYAPDAYYVSLSMVAILLVLKLRRFIEKCLEKLGPIDQFVLFFSKHAFSIYLIHKLQIKLSETVFGLENVINSPLLAATKIFLVVSTSMILAIPFTKLSRVIRERVISLLRV